MPSPRVQPPKPPRTYDPAQSRSALLKAAVDLFGEQGFHETSVQQVADQAKLTKGAFYHHFGSKEDLLGVIHDGFIDAHLDHQARIADAFEDAHTRLFHLVRLLVLIVTERQPEVRIFFQDRRALDARRYGDSFAKRDAAERIYTDTIALGVERGEFRDDLDPHLAALAILGMGNWTYQWYRSQGRLRPEEVALAFGRQALMSVTAQPDRVTALVDAPLPDPDPAR